MGQRVFRTPEGEIMKFSEMFIWIGLYSIIYGGLGILLNHDPVEHITLVYAGVSNCLTGLAILVFCSLKNSGNNK